MANQGGSQASVFGDDVGADNTIVSTVSKTAAMNLVPTVTKPENEEDTGGPASSGVSSVKVRF